MVEQRRQDEQVTGWLKKILNEVPRDRPRENEGPKLAKLTDSDDIEAFLTTFERIMQAFEVAKKRWSYKLAPQLSGKAQQAYAAMKRHKADDYEEVKKAILQRYNITEETYRQRFRSARRSDEFLPRRTLSPSLAPPLFYDAPVRTLLFLSSSSLAQSASC